MIGLFMLAKRKERRSLEQKAKELDPHYQLTQLNFSKKEPLIHQIELRRISMKTIFKSLLMFLATLLSVSSLALAQPMDYPREHEEMGDHPMMHHGMEHPRVQGEECKRNFGWMKPHNAAVHFLEMKDALKLNEKQVSELKALRDSYRAENTVNEAKLKVAEEELRELLFEDTVNVEKTESKIKEIENLKGNLWLSFVRQMAKIKTIVPKEQMKTLHESGPMHHDMKRD